MRKPLLVGTVHLLPLPGSARGGSATDFHRILARAISDASAYAGAGFDALIVENFGDVPFVKDQVGPHVVAAMALIVESVRLGTGLPIGVNVLRNDVVSAVAIAAIAGGCFVRANVYAGAVIADQGVIEGRAEEVQALIKRLGAAVEVWADVDVKHAAPLGARPVAEIAEDALERGLASAVIVTGRATGQPADLDDLRAVHAAAHGAPVYVGSGATVESLPRLLEHAAGAIIGTAAKSDGIVTNPVDPLRARLLVEAATRAR